MLRFSLACLWPLDPGLKSPSYPVSPMWLDDWEMVYDTGKEHLWAILEFCYQSQWDDLIASLLPMPDPPVSSFPSIIQWCRWRRTQVWIWLWKYSLMKEGGRRGKSNIASCWKWGFMVFGRVSHRSPAWDPTSTRWQQAFVSFFKWHSEWSEIGNHK
jgi:hypothetical protein